MIRSAVHEVCWRRRVNGRRPCLGRKKALITGITGQDGSYLAEFLLGKGYDVHGIIRRASTFNTSRINHLYQDPHINGKRLFLHYGDLADSLNLMQLLRDIEPDEVYHLGAQSHVRVSFDIPEYTADVTGVSTVRIPERYNKSDPVNIGAGSEISIRELVELIARLTGFTGQIEWNPAYPDGQPRRALDTSRALREFGFRAKVTFEQGLRDTIDWYQEHLAGSRATHDGPLAFTQSD